MTLFKKVESLFKLVRGNSHAANEVDKESVSYEHTLKRASVSAVGKPLQIMDRNPLETALEQRAIASVKEKMDLPNSLNNQKEIIELILETQEQERRRIAEGLHNGLGQLLYAIKLKFEILGINTEPWNNTKIPSQIEALINEAIEQTRNIAFELMPAILKDFGLEITLYELCKRLDQGPVKFYYSYSIPYKIETVLETAIFRIVQELVNNVLRHSKANEAHIILELVNDSIVVKVRDNGCGFNAGIPAKGIGLSSIRNRVQLLDGQLKINSVADKGTEVVIKIPRT